MEIIKAGVRNEILKLLSLKKYRSLLILIGLIGISASFLGKVSKGLIGLLSNNMPNTVLSISTGFILPLMIAMAAADLFTAEQENGTIKAIITRPISRTSIFITKLLAIIIYVILALLVCLMTSTISNIAFNGIGSLNILETFLVYAISIVPMLPITLFAITVSQVCKNSSSTVMLSVFGYIIIVAVSIIFPSINAMIFTSYTSWYKLFIGAIAPITKILNVFTLLVAYTLILFALSSWAFERKEY